jgi:hypothetical protein
MPLTEVMNELDYIIPALLLFDFMAYTGTILVILKLQHVQKVDHPRGKKLHKKSSCQEKVNLVNVVVGKGRMLL